MKKQFTILLLLITSFFYLGAENSYVNSANRNTAVRCMKLAENCIVGGDWENALKQANLGLSYDDSVSDLIYLKAAALIHMGKTKAEVIEIISSAFEKNEWVGYSKNGARILYADLLSDVGLYDDSMKILDENQMIYSADAEFIRIKNLYRMGTSASINSARLKLNSARRIYPSDVRFPNIFFMFEYIYLMENEKAGNQYELPEIVRNISAFYIKKLPDYSGNNLEMELLASFFADQKEKIRIVNAIDAKNQTVNPSMPIAGLEVGLYSDQQAYEMFFEISGDVISLDLLQIIMNKITDLEVKNQIMEKMLNFTGTLEIDENFDLQNELIIEYETGRPKSLRYDKNNDGIVDLFATCDFGAPNFVYFANNNAQLFYDSYPSVTKISFKDKDYVLNYLHDDFCYSPFNLIPEYFMQQLGLDFYIPYINNNVTFPNEDELLQFANSLELPVAERTDSKVVYTLIDGKFVSAEFYEDSLKYAYCDFSTSFPIIRYADYDADGYFETVEQYDLIGKESSLYDSVLVENNFGSVLKEYPLYLKRILIDRNGNTFYEFSEEYLEDNGKICCWDNNDDGLIDCQYIKYPAKLNESVTEETVYFDKNENPELKLTVIDGVPVKMISRDAEVMVYAGKNNNLYWIEEEGTVDLENIVLKQINKDLQQGKVELIAVDDKRMSVIKVGKLLYCKILPDSEILEENEDSDEDIEE